MGRMTMPNARWYFDFLSPFAYLQLAMVSEMQQIVCFEFRPILFASLLNHHGRRAAMELPSRRRFLYRFAHWRAQQYGISLKFPPAHPFNSLAALRLSIAAGCNADTVTAIFEHIWGGGRRGDDAGSLAAVGRDLGVTDVEDAVSQPWVKDQLKANFHLAIADGVFGIPTVVVDGQLFWGGDSTDMLRAYLADRSLFEGEEIRRLDGLSAG